MAYEITTLGQEIRTFRQLEGLNQEEFAERLGVDRTTLSSWERNASLPRPAKIRRLLGLGVISRQKASELISRSHKGYPIGKYVFDFTISPPRQLLDRGVKFGLLYIRPGPNDGELWSRNPLNLIFQFERVSSRGQLFVIASVRRPDRLGFQFKCFADFEGIKFYEVQKYLQSAGFNCDNHPGEGEPTRLWFLIPGEAIVTTPEGFRDNFFYPE